MEKQRQAERRKYHYIYKTTCSVNNKFYYGMHSTDNLEDGYLGSGTNLWHSIRKHGRENFFLEILEHLPSREALRARERELVNEEILKDPMCMNLKLGGEGGWHLSKEQFKDRNIKCQELRLVRYSEKDWIDKHFPNFKIGAQKRLKSTGWENRSVVTPSWNGKKHSNETKTLMSKVQCGSKNSQYGTCWIFSDSEKKSIKVSNEDVSSYIVSGWCKGRKIKF